MKNRVALLIVALWASILLPASAVPALTPIGGITNVFGDSPNSMVGWSFNLANTITVTSLGYFDADSDGLFEAHRVGIWDNNGSLLLESTVQAGTVDPLLDGFRYNSSLVGTPLLGPGDYVIGGLSPTPLGDPFLRNAGQMTEPGITWTGTNLNFGGGFAEPLPYSGFDAGVFGPNFQFETASAVPEIDTGSATLPLAFCILMGLLVCDRRRGTAALS